MGTIGQKNQLVTIQKVTLAHDSQGGHTETWSTRARVWARERMLTGREAMQAAQVTAVLSSVWEVWFRTDISVKDRIVVGNRVLQIESVVDPTSRRAELWLGCSEVQS
jgi:SPP1 family predicted phage head-tail adaptor